MLADRNFDEIFEQFQRRIKNTKKGQLREVLIREDLQEHVLSQAQRPLRVLDGGCGLGDMGLWLAQQGHDVTASDISQKMVEHTQSIIEDHDLASRFRVQQQSVQQALQAGSKFDLICIHAVMEWLAEPLDLLPLMAPALESGGFLSLTIYNHHRSVFNSLIKGSFQRVLADNFSGVSNAMTPPHPLEPGRVREQLELCGFKLELQAGLRCFYDYFGPRAKDEHSLQDILLLERRYRKLDPYRDFARYVHFIVRKY